MVEATQAEDKNGSTDTRTGNLKNAYRKKGFQTPYTKQGGSVNPNPPPVSSYGTTTTAPTSVHRKGLISPVQQRPVSQGSVIEIPFVLTITTSLLIFSQSSCNVIKGSHRDCNGGASIDIQTVS